ncbi:DUF6333 family protein [Streptomyces endophytica]|uniref:DUF6333 family protein n=1 Tax=Streptomyces endophytica TaxID=2991496 RepID=A0ABY6PGS4_9ACTN|nr:DUF6333 family protein [Streptomyces endophytica]UZJ32747.1 DUF6333 family protein [Streptomyces endophytica]
MTDSALTASSFWDVPPDADVVRSGEYELTLVRSGAPTDASGLPAHDPVAARRFAASFGTIDTVLEDLGTVPATDDPSADTRADLELVRVGSWGGVTEITDPGLVQCNGSFPVEEEAESLAERFPDAVIIASCTVDYSLTYGAYKIIHPDGVRLFAAGWHGEGKDYWDLDGSPADVAAAFGITAAELSDAYVDLNAAAHVFSWRSLCNLALKKVAPLDHTGRISSLFRVRHTEEATGHMEEMWLEAE